MDVAPNEPLALPVLLPVFGFSAISAPTIEGTVYEVNELNALFTQKVLKSVTVPTITLQRGATWYDSDFYRWMLASLTGNTGGFSIQALPILSVGGATYRRTLVLVQYFVNATFGEGFSGLAGATAANAGLAGVGVMVSGGSLGSALQETGFSIGLNAVSSALGFGPLTQNSRIPARAWVLQGCIPTRYKSGGDFDASSSALSIAELDLAVDQLDEISLAG